MFTIQFFCLFFKKYRFPILIKIWLILSTHFLYHVLLKTYLYQFYFQLFFLLFMCMFRFFTSFFLQPFHGSVILFIKSILLQSLFDCLFFNSLFSKFLFNNFRTF